MTKQVKHTLVSHSDQKNTGVHKLVLVLTAVASLSLVACSGYETLPVAQAEDGSIKVASSPSGGKRNVVSGSTEESDDLGDLDALERPDIDSLPDLDNLPKLDGQPRADGERARQPGEMSVVVKCGLPKLEIGVPPSQAKTPTQEQLDCMHRELASLPGIDDLPPITGQLGEGKTGSLPELRGRLNVPSQREK